MKHSKLYKGIINSCKVLLMPVIIYLFFFIASGGVFGNASNMKALLSQSVVNTIISLGLCFTMVPGRWDFSAGAMTYFISIAAGLLMQRLGFGYVGLVAIAALMGLGLGLINGTLYLATGVPSLVFSLGFVMILETGTHLFNNAGGVAILERRILMYSEVPYCLVMLGIMVLFFHIAYEYTAYGYGIRAIGNGQSIAATIGINIRKSALISYVLCGLFTGVAGVQYVTLQAIVRATNSMNTISLLFFTPMMCVLIGRMLSRYAPLALTVFVACFSMQMLATGLLAVGLSATFQDILKGSIMFVVMLFLLNKDRIFSSKAFILLRSRLTGTTP